MQWEIKNNSIKPNFKNYDKRMPNTFEGNVYLFSGSLSCTENDCEPLNVNFGSCETLDEEKPIEFDADTKY